MRLQAWMCGLSMLLLAAGSAAAPRPILVTVDDLPITGATHADAAERDRITTGLLTALAKHRIKAVGLVTWANLYDASDIRLLERWLEAGHELGNHSFRHLDYTRTDSTTYIADVDSCRRALTTLLSRHGQTLRFFRFPFLREGETPGKLAAMRSYLARTGQRNLPVTIDDQDWTFARPWVEARRRQDKAALDSLGNEYQIQLRLSVAEFETLGDEVTQRQPPQILLLHANEVGAAQWEALFTWLERTGHRFAAADEVLADPAFNAPHDFIGPYGCSLWDRLRDRQRREQALVQVTAFLDTSAAAWNRGDFAGFCSHYAEDALFFSPNGITRGREAVETRYRQKYGGSAAARGRLAFEVMEVRLTSGMEITSWGGARPARIQAASVAARWSLAYPDTTAQGLTLLVLHRRRDGTWEIVQDASM